MQVPGGVQLSEGNVWGHDAAKLREKFQDVS